MTADFLLVSNDKYVKNLGICSYSILHNMCGDVDKVRLFIMDCGITEENRKRLRDQTARFENAEIYFHEVSDRVEQIAQKISTRWHPAIYGRLLVSDVRKICDDVDRIVYMDCDTLMDKPVTELFTLDMQGKCVAAVPDADSDHRKKALQLPEAATYINSGVLLIDLPAWIERNAAERVIEYIREAKDELLFPDQDAISYVLWDDMLLLPLEYNMMWMICDSDVPKLCRNIENFPYTEEQVNFALHNIKICHYSGHDMWTFYGITPIQAKLFKKYRKLCDWRNEKRTFETPVKFALWVMKSAKRIVLGDLKLFEK